jgi:hypothetical protein
VLRTPFSDHIGFGPFDSPEPMGGRRVARSAGQTPPTETTEEPEMRPSWLAPALPLLEPVHWVMERRMLKTIKQRAEATTETKSGANGATSEPTA